MMDTQARVEKGIRALGHGLWCSVVLLSLGVVLPVLAYGWLLGLVVSYAVRWSGVSALYADPLLDLKETNALIEATTQTYFVSKRLNDIFKHWQPDDLVLLQERWFVYESMRFQQVVAQVNVEELTEEQADHLVRLGARLKLEIVGEKRDYVDLIEQLHHWEAVYQESRTEKGEPHAHLPK